MNSKTENTKPKRIGKRSSEEEILATWSHVIPDTLRYDEEGKHEGKQTVEIRTRDIHGKPDGQTRRIATSDLFQCFWTEETKDALDKAKRSAKRKLATKSRDEGVASLAALDTVEQGQVDNCRTPGLPRIVKAKAVLTEKAEKLAKKAKPKAEKAKPKADQLQQTETKEERKARLAKVA